MTYQLTNYLIMTYLLTNYLIMTYLLTNYLIMTYQLTNYLIMTYQLTNYLIMTHTLSIGLLCIFVGGHAIHNVAFFLYIIFSKNIFMLIGYTYYYKHVDRKFCHT